MPLSAELRRTHYGPEWRRLSIRLRAEAGHRCQCRGECGREHRGRCPETEGYAHRPPVLPGIPAPAAARKPPLTVAHLNHTPGDDRPENLRVLCVACHLRYDQEYHLDQRRRREAREARARAEAGGQLVLFAD